MPVNKIELDLDKIKRFSIIKEKENWDFRSFLKSGKVPIEKVDFIVHSLYKEISSIIDCNDCMNCCNELQPVLDQEDIDKISIKLGITDEKFIKQYLIKDDSSFGYVFNEKPCPFLKNNKCSCYNYRPKDCVSFPHIYKKSFVLRLTGVIENYAVCPKVFNVYEELKAKIWHKKR